MVFYWKRNDNEAKAQTNNTQTLASKLPDYSDDEVTPAPSRVEDVGPATHAQGHGIAASAVPQIDYVAIAEAKIDALINPAVIEQQIAQKIAASISEQDVSVQITQQCLAAVQAQMPAILEQIIREKLDQLLQEIESK